MHMLKAFAIPFFMPPGSHCASMNAGRRRQREQQPRLSWACCASSSAWLAAAAASSSSLAASSDLQQWPQRFGKTFEGFPPPFFHGNRAARSR
jgi:hypothetical protein